VSKRLWRHRQVDPTACSRMAAQKYLAHFHAVKDLLAAVL
jgi:hypothetical protein